MQECKSIRRNELELILASMNRDYMGGTQPEESDDEVQDTFIWSIADLVKDMQMRVRDGWENAAGWLDPSQNGGGQPGAGVWHRYMLGNPGIVDMGDTSRNQADFRHDTRFLSQEGMHWTPLWLRHVGVHAGGVPAGVIACALADLWRLLAEFYDDDASLIEVFGIANGCEEEEEEAAQADRYTSVKELLIASALWEGILGSDDAAEHPTSDALVHVYATRLGDREHKYRQHAHMAVRFSGGADKVVLVRMHAPVVVHVGAALVASDKWTEMLQGEDAAAPFRGSTAPHVTFRSRSASPASSCSSSGEEEETGDERPRKRRRRCRLETMTVQLRHLDTTSRSFHLEALDTVFESLVRPSP
jgi:hypothetical protein